MESFEETLFISLAELLSIFVPLTARMRTESMVDDLEESSERGSS